jgi:hypothetical protein
MQQKEYTPNNCTSKVPYKATCASTNLQRCLEDVLGHAAQPTNDVGRLSKVELEAATAAECSISTPSTASKQLKELMERT